MGVGGGKGKRGGGFLEKDVPFFEMGKPQGGKRVENPLRERQTVLPRGPAEMGGEETCPEKGNDPGFRHVSLKRRESQKPLKDVVAKGDIRKEGKTKNSANSNAISKQRARKKSPVLQA